MVNGDICRLYQGLNLGILRKDLGFHAYTLRALADANQLDLFDIVLDQYVEYCNQMRDRSHFGYNIASICSSLSRIGRYDKSLAIYNRFYSPKDPQCEISIYASQRAISCCLREKKLSLALRYTIEGVIEGLNIDYPYADSLIRVASETKRYDIVCQLFDWVESNPSPIELYNVLKIAPDNEAELCTLHIHYPDVEEQLRAIPPLLSGHKRTTYFSILGAFSRCDAHQQAIDIFEKIRKESLFTSSPCLKSCINVIAACCLSQQYDLAIDYYRAFTSLGKLLSRRKFIITY